MGMGRELLKQLLRRPATNPFPVKRLPGSVASFRAAVKAGRKAVAQPVAVPDSFRGRVLYHRDKCIGCRMCTKVCPAEAVVFIEKERKIRYHLSRCAFCGECVDICPVKALEFTKDFLLADYSKG